MATASVVKPFVCARDPPPSKKKLCASIGSKSMLFLTGQFLVSCLIIPPVLATINILYHLMMFCSFFLKYLYEVGHFVLEKCQF
jgi:hypothetical protein